MPRPGHEDPRARREPLTQEALAAMGPAECIGHIAACSAQVRKIRDSIARNSKSVVVDRDWLNRATAAEKHILREIGVVTMKLAEVTTAEAVSGDTRRALRFVAVATGLLPPETVAQVWALAEQPEEPPAT